MKTSFLVVDNDFNRAWYADLIGKRFEVPPSYACVMESTGKADFYNAYEYTKGNRND